MKITFHNEERKINDLIPYEHNPRQITEKQIEVLKASLEKFDLAEIPVVNLDNTIIAGHQRIKVLQLLGRGEELIDVRVPNQVLTVEDVKEYNARSNISLGSFDFDILANTFGYDELSAWGFPESDLNKGFGITAEEPPHDPNECERCLELRKAIIGHQNHAGHSVIKTQEEKDETGSDTSSTD